MVRVSMHCTYTNFAFIQRIRICTFFFSGRPYLFQVRAFNRVGPGPWSDSLEVVSGAGAPDTPHAPRVQCRGPTVAILDWNEPSFNGAMVTEYRLQLAVVSSRKCLSPPPTLTTEASSTMSSSTSSSVIEDEEDYDDDLDDDLEERQESLDDSDEPEAPSDVRNKVKRKRKSYREQDDEENSDSDEDHDLNIRNRTRMPPTTTSTTAASSSSATTPSRKEKAAAANPFSKEELAAAANLEDNLEDDELPKELLFTNIFTGNSRNFEARYVCT